MFWSKNPKPMLNQIDKLKDFTFYFLYTLNPYPTWIEGGLPPLEDRIELSKYCPDIVLLFGVIVIFYLRMK